MSTLQVFSKLLVFGVKGFLPLVQLHLSLKLVVDLLLSVVLKQFVPLLSVSILGFLAAPLVLLVQHLVILPFANLPHLLILQLLDFVRRKLWLSGI